jgi:molecular chaperone GrpE
MNDSKSVIDPSTPAREQASSAPPQEGPGTDIEGLGLQELRERNEQQRLRIGSLQAEVAALTQEAAAFRDTVTAVRIRYREASEEFERAKGRIQREAAAEIAKERAELLRPFLATVDDLERAIDSADDPSSHGESQILDGLRLIHANLLHTLAELGVTPLPAEGRRFDATVCEAVDTLVTHEPEKVGRVIDVLARGYLLNDQVLRPAKVVVGKEPALDIETDSSR